MNRSKKTQLRQKAFASSRNSYRLYGVQVSSDFALYEATPSRPNVKGAVRKELTLQAFSSTKPAMENWCEHDLGRAHGRQLKLQTHGELAATAQGQNRQLVVQNVVSLYWQSGDTAIYYRLDQSGSYDLLSFWFTHILLPLHLTLECNFNFLHASAVEIDQGAILFLAGSTGGKSTMANYFLHRGHGLVSDDKVSTFLEDSACYAEPSCPFHRPWREHEVLGDRVEQFSSAKTPVRTIYLLERNSTDVDIEIEELTGYRKFEALLSNYLYTFDFLHPHRLAWLAELAERTPIYRIRRPWDLSRLGDVYEAICEHERSNTLEAR
ncbi:MAG: hypothetical protein AAGI44_18950 [Pseudomonadota bacterium]